ncbi:MAG TPA: hypothetical protein VIK18_15700 [Pirellulales bacterium]
MPGINRSDRWLLWLLLVLAMPGGLAARELPLECKQCNGSAILCDRRYDQVAYATTHNSMSNRHDHWLAPNQNFGITQQLDAGIRALMLDVHAFMGRPYLAHTSVLFGRKPLVDGLGEVRTFLDAHPFEIVTIILENYVPSESLDQAFTAAGLEPYLYAHRRGQPFPTLREMVLSGKRLVVFTDRGGGDYPWLHAVWDYCFDTPWKAKSPAELKNQAGRGDPRNPLLIVNHFLMNPLPSVRLAVQVNQNPFLMNRIFACAQEMQRMPNFINVDFYDIGDVFEVVDTLNGLPLAQRRTAAKRPSARVWSPIRLWK